MKKITLTVLTFCIILFTNCSKEEDTNNDNSPTTISIEKLFANIGNEKLVEINLSNGSQSLITTFQTINDALDGIIYLNNEFIGTKYDGTNYLIKKINTDTGSSTTITTIDNFADLTPSKDGKLYANIGNEKLVEINLADGSQSLITTFQTINDALDGIIYLNNEFIGTKYDGTNYLIKKINTDTGSSTTITTIDNFADLIY